MSNKTTLSRKAALARSQKLLNRALRVFSAAPSNTAHSAVAHALDAVQRAQLLSDDPEHQRDDEVRRWKRAWLAARLALRRKVARGGAT